MVFTHPPLESPPSDNQLWFLLWFTFTSTIYIATQRNNHWPRIYLLFNNCNTIHYISSCAHTSKASPVVKSVWSEHPFQWRWGLLKANINKGALFHVLEVQGWSHLCSVVDEGEGYLSKEGNEYSCRQLMNMINCDSEYNWTLYISTSWSCGSVLPLE